MRSTFRILFFLKRDRPRADGFVPIFCRITIDGKEARFGLKTYIHPEIWDVGMCMAAGKTVKAVKINTLLDQTKAALQNIYKDVLLSEVDVTAEKVKNLFLGITARSYTVMTLFDQHNEDVKKQVGVGKSKTTYQKYERTRNHLSDFLNVKYRVSDISFKEINHKLLTDFEVYLKTSCGCNANTTAKFMQFFKRIVLIARNNGWLRTDPFVNYPIRINSVDRGYLTEREIEAIMKKEFTLKRLEQVRDIFIFSCFTGLAYIDVANLRKENIRDAFDGKLWIIGKREKTGITFKIPLLDVAKMILEKYKNLPTGKLLPILSNQKTNSYLKEIGNACGISKDITFHLARHSFATYLLSKGVSIESVSKMLGHTNIKTTQIYARVLDTKVSDDMAQLADKIKGVENLMVSNHNYGDNENR